MSKRKREVDSAVAESPAKRSQGGFWTTSQSQGQPTPWTAQDAAAAEVRRQARIAMSNTTPISQEELIGAMPKDLLREIMRVMAKAEKAEVEEAIVASHSRRPGCVGWD